MWKGSLLWSTTDPIAARDLPTAARAFQWHVRSSPLKPDALLDASSDVPWSDVVSAIDAFKQAGFRNVNLTVPAD